jgi:2'-5' RNA ligase
MELLVTTVTSEPTSGKILNLAKHIEEFSHHKGKPIFYHVGKQKRHIRGRIFRDHEAIASYPPHITLTPTFDAEDEKPMLEALRKVVKDKPPIKVEAEKVALYKRNSKSVKANLMTKPNPRLRQLREEIVENFREYAKIKSLDYFMPHFTLFYDDIEGVPGEALQYIEDKKVKFEFTIKELVLSKRTKDGYKYIKRFKLQG